MSDDSTISHLGKPFRDCPPTPVPTDYRHETPQAPIPGVRHEKKNGRQAITMGSAIFGSREEEPSGVTVPATEPARSHYYDEQDTDIDFKRRARSLASDDENLRVNDTSHRRAPLGKQKEFFHPARSPAAPNRVSHLDGPRPSSTSSRNPPSEVASVHESDLKSQDSTARYQDMVDRPLPSVPRSHRSVQFEEQTPVTGARTRRILDRPIENIPERPSFGPTPVMNASHTSLRPVRGSIANTADIASPSYHSTPRRGPPGQTPHPRAGKSEHMNSEQVVRFLENADIDRLNFDETETGYSGSNEMSVTMYDPYGSEITLPSRDVPRLSPQQPSELSLSRSELITRSAATLDLAILETAEAFLRMKRLQAMAEVRHQDLLELSRTTKRELRFLREALKGMVSVLRALRDFDATREY